MIEVGPAPVDHYQWIAERAGLTVGDNFRALEALENGQIVGMVGYDGWTPNSCTVHVAIDKPMALRRLVGPGFRIPFERCGFDVVLASVLSTNSKSLSLAGAIGFTEIACVRDGWQRGVDMHFFEMRREDCRWLRSH